jgi:uncharacterized protein YoxC
MKLNNFVKTGYLVVALAAIPTLASAAGRTVAPAEIASQSFGTLRDNARELLTIAARLNATAGTMTADHESHAYQLANLKDAVNELGATLYQLESTGTSLSAAQRQEIDRATELARTIADNATSAIEFASNHPQSLWRAEYRRYTGNVESASEELAKLVDGRASANRLHVK